MRKIITSILIALAKLTLRKYSPGIIGITGSVGKTSTKEAIATVLRGVRRVRASAGNFNGEIGLPLTILGDWPESELALFGRVSAGKSLFFGKLFFIAKAIIVSLWRLMFGSAIQYPELLVLEYGADKPLDIKELLDVVKPSMSVVTAVGNVPAHVEFYSGPEAVAREKGRLVEALPATGFAILNFDDEVVLEMKEKTRAHVITYGFGQGAEVRITGFENRSDNGRPSGIAFKLEYGGSFVPVRLDDCFGRAQAYAAAASAAVGFAFGMNLVKISEMLHYYQPPERRMKLLLGVKETYVIDDSYNASPLAMEAAIETIKSLSVKGRKIGVFGDMLEIGKYAMDAHESIGRLAGKVFDALFVIGPRAKFIAEGAMKSGLAKKQIFSYDTVDEAEGHVGDLLKKGDLVLVKGSYAMHLDTLVDEIRQS